MLIGSEYKVASDEENAQIDELSKILKSYDKDGCLSVRRRQQKTLST